MHDKSLKNPIFCRLYPRPPRHALIVPSCPTRPGISSMKGHPFSTVIGLREALCKTCQSVLYTIIPE